MSALTPEKRSGTDGRLETRHRTCPACETDNRDEPRLADSLGDWNLKACRACGFVYLENTLDESLLATDYAWERTRAVERAARRKRRFLWYLLSDTMKGFKMVGRGFLPRQIRLIRRYFAAGRFLDVGCGKGKVYRFLTDRHVPFGIEVSQQLAQEAAEKCRHLNGRVIQDQALGGIRQFLPEWFDGVLMNSYLEHETQPKLVLREAHRVLKSEGTMIVKVPNYASFNRRIRGRRWCGYRFPEHVNYFTPDTLTAMLEQCGFAVARCNLSDRFPLNDNLWVVARKAAMSASRAA